MLKGNNDEIDLKAKAETLLPSIETRLHELAMSRGDYKIERLTETETQIHYPVSEFPKKIKSHNFDKEAVVSGTLMGIKGQYLLFDTGVINIRKFTSYEVEVSY